LTGPATAGGTAARRRPTADRAAVLATFEGQDYQESESPMSHFIPRVLRRGSVAAGLLVAGVSVLGTLGTVRAQVGPEESGRMAKAAEGLEAKLWAAEPLLLNPTSIDVDSRGRVWVSEGLNYRLTRGGNKRFSRIEESDKIKILEDTDGDGKADKVTVFADRIFPVPMGLAVEERYDKDGKYQGARVFVGNSPDLLVLEDTDGDDKADRRYALLTGFGGIDSDHGVHGMTLGLDGKLYFTHGDGCCSVQQDKSERAQNFDVVDKSGRHVSSDQLANTLRVNRDGTQFEVICDRQRNNYETSVNAFGNIFTSDNDDDGNRGCRVIWAMDGGHYGYRTPGSTRHWGEDVPGNVPKIVGTGNGSPCGIMVYEGNLLPDVYRGGLFEVDAGTRQVNFFPLTRHGAAFRTEARVLLTSDDPWFRPTDACAAPDGAVFVSDWYDAGVGGHAFSDQTTGRIYRVAPAGHKVQTPQPDFKTVDGLIAALRSPVIASQDAARRSLIARGDEPAVMAAVSQIAVHDPDLVVRARALWTWYGIGGDPIALAALTEAVHGGEPRIREMAVRMLGRDCRENGKVEYKTEASKLPPAALKHLDVLKAMADDPDAGVRRELILALRNLPTEAVGDALRKLTASWDGQDRWYLEALGLALEHRESEFIASLFRDHIFGELGDLDAAGRDGSVALPPYFPADRNEAYIAVGSPERSASPLSKSLGLAWRLRRPEVLPLLVEVLHHLRAPEMQQAGDDILRQLNFPQAAPLVADAASRIKDPVRKRQLLNTLARKLDAEWRPAHEDPAVTRIINETLRNPVSRVEGIALAAATGDALYADVLKGFAKSSKDTEEVKVAAVEAIGVLNPPHARSFLDRLIAEMRGRPSSSPAAEAAVRSLPRVGESRTALANLMTATDVPLGIRREALRSLVQLRGGARQVLDLAKAGKLAADLKTEASTILNTLTDRGLRDEAATVLPLPKTLEGRTLPPIGDLIRREGDPGRGEQVFFRESSGATACGGCHRVQGRGQWIGPDLSTIGTKYGRDELIRSILNPSAAIGFAFRSQVVALADGRVLTGLPTEDTPERLVLKTADGQRIPIRPADIEDRKTSDVSLMPEGLAQTMTDQELVDLLAFLSTLKEPVSVVGQYRVVGPLAEKTGQSAIDPAARIDFEAGVPSADGRRISWRRLDTNAEGLADFSPILAGQPDQFAYAAIPVVSPVSQPAKLVLDSRATLSVWLNGKPVSLSEGQKTEAGNQVAELTLPEGSSSILIRVGPGMAEGKTVDGEASSVIVTTLVTSKPVSFSGSDTPGTSR
jgi:putative membrane-bound dehydrogenase-like protein